MDALRLTALVLTVALSVPASVLILRTMGPPPSGEPGLPRRRRMLEAAFSLTPVVLLAVLIGFAVARP